MVCLLLTRRICVSLAPRLKWSTLKTNSCQIYTSKTIIYNARQSKYTVRLWSAHKICSSCLKNIPKNGMRLALISPFAFFKKRKDFQPTHEELALAQIPHEVFKADVLKKKKRAFLWQILTSILSNIRLCLRFIRLLLTFGPLLSLYPLAYLNSGFRIRWFNWLKIACEWTGPTFIKLGQWAGTRRDLFPDEFCNIFSELHTKVRPHSWYMTRRKLTKSFGKNWTDIFVAVDRKPIGSGCIAQVHKAYMRQAMVPDESVIEEVLEDEDPGTEIDFSEGLEVLGFGHVIDSTVGQVSNESYEYEHNSSWWRQKGVSLPSTSDKKDYHKMLGQKTTGSQEVSKNGPGKDKDKEEPPLIPVAIKVLHPSVYRAVWRDITILKTLARIAQFLFPSLQWLSLPECVDEFSTMMTKQIDLRYEARALEKFVDNFAEVPNIRFPRPIIPYCKRDVIVETFEEGELISNYVNASESPFGLKQILASYGLDALLQMVFVDNFVHGDLHPGNILVQNSHTYVPQEENKLMLVDVCDTIVVNVTPAEVPIRLVMLDVGISISLSDYDLQNFKNVFAAVVIGEGETVAELMLKHSTYSKCKDVEAFKKDLSEIVRQARVNKIKLGKINVTDLLSQVFRVLSHHKVKLESNFASVILAIFVLEGLGRALDPEIDILERAKPILLGGS